MALYSWFSRIDKKPSKKQISINDDLLKSSSTIKYIESYTMWPTAKIKPDVEVTIPNFGDKLLEPKAVALPTSSKLTAIKG
jgi:hypothetical protein